MQAELEQGGLWPGFSRELEQVFESETGQARCHHLIRSGILAMVLPNAFLLAELHVVSDVFGYALLLHAACTVLYSVVLFQTARRLGPAMREALHGSTLTLAIVGAIGLFWASGNPDRGYLTVTFMLFIVYVNVVMRLRFGWCLAFNATGTIAAGLSVAAFGEGFPHGVRTLVLLSILTAAFFTIYANYTFEMGERKSFLLTLDQRLAAMELEMVNAKLSALTTTDWLTGVANRRGLEEYLAEAWAQAEAAGQPISLLMVDVDHFKLYNDRHGHPAGDKCLARLAVLISQQLRMERDRLARYGGEEFAVILPHTAEQDATRAAERIRQGVADLAMEHGAPGAGPFLTVSIGVKGGTPASGGSPQALIAAADQALYESKRRGRNRVHPMVLWVEHDFDARAACQDAGSGLASCA